MSEEDYDCYSFPKKFLTPDAGNWSICDDCLDPLAAFLEKAKGEWVEHGLDENDLKEAMTTISIWWKYMSEPINSTEADGWHTKCPDISFAIVWLSVNLSQDLADRFRYEIRRVMKRVTGAVDKMGRIHAEWKQFAPEPKYDEHTGIQMLGFTKSEMLDIPLLDRYKRQIDRSMARACRYLRQLSVAMRAKGLPDGPAKSAVQESSDTGPPLRFPKTIDDTEPREGYLSIRQGAEKFDVSEGALRKRLERRSVDFIRCEDPKPRQPHKLYDEETLREIADDIKRRENGRENGNGKHAEGAT